MGRPGTGIGGCLLSWELGDSSRGTEWEEKELHWPEQRHSGHEQG